MDCSQFSAFVQDMNTTGTWMYLAQLMQVVIQTPYKLAAVYCHAMLLPKIPCVENTASCLRRSLLHLKYPTISWKLIVEWF